MRRRISCRPGFGTKPAVCLIALFASFALVSGLSAQEGGTTSDLDSLFGDEIVEVKQDNSVKGVPDTVAADPLSSVLKSEKVRIGGSYTGTVTATATWEDIFSGASLLRAADTTDLAVGAKATLYFDARPTDVFRVYGSAKTAWPFESVSGGVNVPDVSIFELFSDFTAGDTVFFRFGKSTVKWGVGYFWSPADVINLETINLFDATAQREGPLNFRVHIPVFGTQHNFYMYAIVDESDVAFSTTALAARAEFLIGAYELGIGGYYRNDTAERGMVTLTGPIGNLDVFAEAMVSRGSSKRFVSAVAIPPTGISFIDSATVRSTWYASASAGFMYSSPKDNLTAIAQYYYNGEGYSDTDRDSLIAQAQAAIANLSASPATAAAAAAYRQALVGLVLGSGRHYAAANLSLGKVFNDDISISVLAIANLSDLSGIVRPTVTWAALDNFKMNLGATLVFGPENGEYVLLTGGNTLALSMGCTVSGAF
jgi:hypothetical protein